MKWSNLSVLLGKRTELGDIFQHNMTTMGKEASLDGLGKFITEGPCNKSDRQVFIDTHQLIDSQ